MLDCAAASAKAGKVVLFIGNETLDWKPQDFANAAAFAHSLGVDTIAPKRGNGNQRWYGSTANLRAEREATLAQGVGYLPFMYSYGPAFGGAQYQVEADIIREMASVCDGLACIDMEVEWNGHAAEAAQFAKLLEGAGTLWCSTWADPVQQNWQQVIRALAPVIAVWGPQEYTRFLATTESQISSLGITCIHPELDLSRGFDAQENPLTLAQEAVQRGHQSVWLWEYAYAKQQTQLVSQIVAALHQGSVPLPPPPGPPLPGGWLTYIVQSGDSLSAIAAFLGLSSWHSDLYQPNLATLQEAAHAHGHPEGDHNGDLIFPGTVLRYRR